MAFTEEQEKTILDFIAKTSTTAPVEKTVVEDKSKVEDALKTKTIAEQAKEAVEVEKAGAMALTQIQESIKFNLSVNDFVEKNKAYLPDEAAKILATVATKTFKDENEKANTVRKSLLDALLSQAENINVLTPSMKEKANQYKALAESDKEKRSSEFWDLAEVGLALKEGARKAEALNKVNGVNAGEDSKNIIGSKILTLAKERFQPIKI